VEHGPDDWIPLPSLKLQTPVHEYVKKTSKTIDSNMTRISVEDQLSAANWATIKGSLSILDIAHTYLSQAAKRIN